jgi:UDP-N-acetylglucosamine:LPS N-acetylglucosamine transferase
MACAVPSSKQPTVALVANSGGHIIELRALEAAFREFDYFYITLKRQWTEQLQPAYFVTPPGTGRFQNLRYFCYLVRVMTVIPMIMALRRPDCVVSTGAEVALPAFWIGKLFGARTVYVESVTRYEKLSRAARWVRPVTDVFLAQQPSLVACDPARIRFEGNVL